MNEAAAVPAVVVEENDADGDDAWYQGSSPMHLLAAYLGVRLSIVVGKAARSLVPRDHPAAMMHGSAVAAWEARMRALPRWGYLPHRESASSTARRLRTLAVVATVALLASGVFGWGLLDEGLLHLLLG